MHFSLMVVFSQQHQHNYRQLCLHLVFILVLIYFILFYSLKKGDKSNAYSKVLRNVVLACQVCSTKINRIKCINFSCVIKISKSCSKLLFILKNALNPHVRSQNHGSNSFVFSNYIKSPKIMQVLLIRVGVRRYCLVFTSRNDCVVHYSCH